MDTADDDTALVLTFNEALDTGSMPAATAFEVTVGTAAAANPDAVAVSGRTVTLTLAASVGASDTVTLDYTKPASNPVQDVHGNDAANVLRAGGERDDGPHDPDRHRHRGEQQSSARGRPPSGHPASSGQQKRGGDVQRGGGRQLGRSTALRTDSWTVNVGGTNRRPSIGENDSSTLDDRAYSSSSGRARFRAT